MPRPKLTTTQRGLGAAHQAQRARLLWLMQPGQPCCICGQPMYGHQPLELDHLIPRRLGGKDGPTALAHRYCNRRRGAILANKLRAGRPRRRPRQPRW